MEFIQHAKTESEIEFQVLLEKNCAVCMYKFYTNARHISTEYDAGDDIAAGEASLQTN